MTPRYPWYIPSKGRATIQKTSQVLTGYGVPHYVVVEEHQRREYEAHKSPLATILVLPESYLDEYDTCDSLGRTKSVGPGAARNFIWDHATESGSRRHWVSDDNIRAFWRFNRNRQIRVGDGTCLAVMEDFVDRYTNIAMAGPQYYMFIARKDKYPPYVLNTRIYSCNLILNEAPFRWRGRYNEDTDLSLRMLKAGWCTVQFNAFLQHKIPTQMLAGGNTEAFYAAEGTKPKSEMLAKLHPDVARVVWKFGRWHHEVDYGPFRRNELVRLPGVEIPEGVDDYGLRLYRHNPDGSWSEVPEDAKNDGPDFEEAEDIELTDLAGQANEDEAPSFAGRPGNEHEPHSLAGQANEDDHQGVAPGRRGLRDKEVRQFERWQKDYVGEEGLEEKDAPPPLVVPEGQIGMEL